MSIENLTINSNYNGINIVGNSTSQILANSTTINIGSNNTAGYLNGIVIGISAQGSINTVSIGRNAFVGSTGIQNIAIGYNAQSSISSAYGIGIGYYAAGGGTNSIAIGYNSNTNNYNYSTAIGPSAYSQGVSAIAIGNSPQANSSYAIAIGTTAYATAAGAVAIGTDSGGTGAQSSITNQIVLGTTSHTTIIPGAANIVGNLNLSGSTSGTTIVRAQNVSIGNTATLPVGNVKIAGANFDYVTATTTNSSSTAYVTPTGFNGFTVYAGRTYTFEVNAFVSISGTGGLKVRFNYPTLTTGGIQGVYFFSGGAPIGSASVLTTGSTTLYIGLLISSNTIQHQQYKGFIVPSASGTLAFDFVTSSSATASVVASSWFTMTEVK
jgi:hypothetical protein